MNEDEQFKATLEMLIPLIVKEMVKARDFSDNAAFVALYSSQVYCKMENEKTKLWHLSPLCLSNLVLEEIDTGHVSYPMEA